jgi:uncharacterized protein YkwD
VKAVCFPLVAIVTATRLFAVLDAANLMLRSEGDFLALPGLASRIDQEALDEALLAAAIFHETNKIRRLHGLPAFRCLPKLNDAARIQAAVGGVYRPPSHINPFPWIATPADRVQHAGLAPAGVAENIALLSSFEVDPASGVALDQRNGAGVFVNAATGRKLQPQTYAGFAATVVQAWLDSPGHRENLLHAQITHLGCAVRALRGERGQPMIFSVQVFYLPTQPPDESPIFADKFAGGQLIRH